MCALGRSITSRLCGCHLPPWTVKHGREAQATRSLSTTRSSNATSLPVAAPAAHGLRPAGDLRCPVERGLILLLAGVICLLGGGAAFAEIRLPQPDSAMPIEVSAEAANRWHLGSYEVWILRGRVRLAQGHTIYRAKEAVLWVDRNRELPEAFSLTGTAGDRFGRSRSGEGQPNRIIAYFEDVEAAAGSGERQQGRMLDPVWFGRFETYSAVRIEAEETAGEPDPLPPVFRRAVARRNTEFENAVRRTQYLVEDGGPVTGSLLGEASPAEGLRRIRVFPRSEVPVQAQWFPDPQTGQWIAVIDAGVNLVIDGLDALGTIDVSADRLVLWTTADEEPDLTGNRGIEGDVPLEIYMEGNIVFRQGERVIYAERMYYDVTRNVGIVLNAEMLTPVPNYEGLLRLRASVLRQLNRDQFFGENVFLTSSRMGKPTFRLESQSAFVEDIQQPATDPLTGMPRVDPETGEPVVEHRHWATSRNNWVYLGDVPVFYWPVLATDLTEPSYYLRRAQVKNDNIFGTQVLTNWDVYQLFGVRNKPEGTDWDLSLDYLSERGLGYGSTFTYSRDQFFGLTGFTTGLVDFWAISDDGVDNLGRDRRALDPEESYRYRLLWQHRQYLPRDYQLTAEVGLISDRNFLEQYFESEWDELKDQSTGVELKRSYDNVSWALAADYRVNDHVTGTDWLPRFDHYWLGQPLLRDTFTWYEHTSLGFARLRTADAPDDPGTRGAFSYLPWETSAVTGDRLSTNSERFITRQEIDWPFLLGPVKIVPYALGELAHWGEDRYGEDMQRTYAQLGMRASMPMWSVNPYVASELWNLQGIAHKVTFEAEAFWAEANRDMTDLPLYDPLDDDAVEAFRRRLSVLSYGSGTGYGGPPAPFRFDERSYALRTGMAGWVTAPSLEVAEDLTLLRMGARQRWQTKRGMPGRERIVDWLALNTHITFFPDSSRDNFNRFAGLLDYDVRWHPGDRLTLTSYGVFDFFDSGQRLVTFGGFLSRPPRGNLYLGLRFLDGPIHSTVLSGAYSYRMSSKWMSTFGMSIDLGESANIGQNFSVTRIGESFLVTAGINVDASRDSVGVNLAVEPRFLPRRRLGDAVGAAIPVAGSQGLE